MNIRADRILSAGGSTFRTQDVDQARQEIDARYYANFMDVIERQRRPFAAEFDTFALGPLVIGDLSCGADVRMRFGELGAFHVNAARRNDGAAPGRQRPGGGDGDRGGGARPLGRHRPGALERGLPHPLRQDRRGRSARASGAAPGRPTRGHSRARAAPGHHPRPRSERGGFRPEVAREALAGDSLAVQSWGRAPPGGAAQRASAGGRAPLAGRARPPGGATAQARARKRTVDAVRARPNTPTPRPNSRSSPGWACAGSRSRSGSTWACHRWGRP